MLLLLLLPVLVLLLLVLVLVLVLVAVAAGVRVACRCWSLGSPVERRTAMRASRLAHRRSLPGRLAISSSTASVTDLRGQVIATWLTHG